MYSYINSVIPCLLVHVLNPQYPLTNFDEIWYWRLALNICWSNFILAHILSPKIIHFLYEIDIFLYNFFSTNERHIWSKLAQAVVFVFGRWPVRNSSGTSTALTNVSMIFLCASKQMRRGHGRLLPNPFPFIIHVSSYKSMLHTFLFSTSSRLALGPTQPPIQWVPRALSSEIKWPGREADHSFLSCRGQERWMYTSSPPHVFIAMCLISEVKLSLCLTN
jgi:hypothetical protein